MEPKSRLKVQTRSPILITDDILSHLTVSLPKLERVSRQFAAPFIENENRNHRITEFAEPMCP